MFSYSLAHPLGFNLRAITVLACMVRLQVKRGRYGLCDFVAELAHL